MTRPRGGGSASAAAPGHREPGDICGYCPRFGVSLLGWQRTVFACAEDLCSCWKTCPSDTSFLRFIFVFCLKKHPNRKFIAPMCTSDEGWSAAKGRSAQRSAEFLERADGSGCSVIPSSPDTPALMAPALPGCRPGLPSQPGGFGSAFVVGRRLQGDRLCRRSCRSRVGAGSSAWQSTGHCWLPGGKGASSGSAWQIWEVSPTCQPPGGALSVGWTCLLTLVMWSVPFPPVPWLQRAVALSLCWRSCAELPLLPWVLWALC